MWKVVDVQPMYKIVKTKSSSFITISHNDYKDSPKPTNTK